MVLLNVFWRSKKLWVSVYLSGDLFDNNLDTLDSVWNIYPLNQTLPDGIIMHHEIELARFSFCYSEFSPSLFPGHLRLSQFALDRSNYGDRDPALPV